MRILYIRTYALGMWFHISTKNTARKVTLGIVVIWRLFTDSEKSSLRKGLGPPS